MASSRACPPVAPHPRSAQRNEQSSSSSWQRKAIVGFTHLCSRILALRTAFDPLDRATVINISTSLQLTPSDASPDDSWLAGGMALWVMRCEAMSPFLANYSCSGEDSNLTLVDWARTALLWALLLVPLEKSVAGANV